MSLLVAARARAADVVVEGNVVSRDGDDLVLDLGAQSGARDGDVIELWRPIRVKHPVSGKVIADRFRIGALRLSQVRPRLAFARAEGTMERTPIAGDVVVLRRAGADPPIGGSKKAADASTKAAEETSLAAPCFPDPDAADLSRLFESLLGAPPPARAAAYDAFVLAHPRSKFVAVLREEAHAFRALPPPAEARPELRGSFAPPELATAGIPLSLALELTGGAAGAVLHVRRADAVAYSSFPFQRAGEGYFALTLPCETMVAPGLAYFVEATLPDGSARAIVGSAAAPSTLSVEELPRPTPPTKLGYAASLWTDYALWTTSPSLASANDRVSQTEGQFAMRQGDVGVRAVRSGFGVFRGRGGTLADLDDPHASRGARSVGLTYGYLELEWGFDEKTSLIGRGVVGLRDDGVGGGGQAFVRLGSDRRTNLALGGEVLGGIGLRGIAQLEWRTIPRWGVILRTEVTNQPAGVALSPAARSAAGTAVSDGQGEVGARAIAQLGYRVTEGLELAIRGSYQGRTIKHAGPGAGAAVTFEW